jgi:hypothetical protein
MDAKKTETKKVTKVLSENVSAWQKRELAALFGPRFWAENRCQDGSDQRAK